ncbi:hypothetical protein MMSP_2903 [Mycobacterium sp. 012931]|nr:hypothetical protein MMSP_2903 [Mycobacterium sp. 012931]
MSYVIAAPEEFASAARNLANIGVTINAANANAILATTEVIQPGADAVSAAITALINSHGLGYQSISQQTTAFHDRFVQTVNAAAASYTTTDLTAASLLKQHACRSQRTRAGVVWAAADRQRQQWRSRNRGTRRRRRNIVRQRRSRWVRRWRSRRWSRWAGRALRQQWRRRSGRLRWPQRGCRWCRRGRRVVVRGRRCRRGGWIGDLRYRWFGRGRR